VRPRGCCSYNVPRPLSDRPPSRLQEPTAFCRALSASAFFGVFRPQFPRRHPRRFGSTQSGAFVTDEGPTVGGRGPVWRWPEHRC